MASLVQVPRQHGQRLLQFAAAHPLLEAAMAGLKGRILLRQFTPLRSRAQYPEHPIEHGTRVMPWATAIIRSPLRTQHRLHYLPLFVG